MERFKLQCDLWVPAPIDEVWAFGMEPKNLARITPAFYHAHIPEGAKTQNGERFTITLSPFNLPIKLKWVSVIKDVVDTGDRRQFTDLQESGPFSFWKHQHIFEKGDESVQGQRSNSKVKVHQPGTWIRDRVDYALPLASLGRFANRIYVQRSLEKMFSYRVRKLADLFETSRKA